MKALLEFGLMYRRFLPLILALAALAQEAEVKILDPQDTAALRRLYAAKIEADRAWEEARVQIERKYTTSAGVAESGGMRSLVRNPLRGWEHGATFNRTLDAIVPRIPAASSESEARYLPCASFDHVNTIPEKPWLTQ